MAVLRIMKITRGRFSGSQMPKPASYPATHNSPQSPARRFLYHRRQRSGLVYYCVFRESIQRRSRDMSLPSNYFINHWDSEHLLANKEERRTLLYLAIKEEVGLTTRV